MFTRMVVFFVLGWYFFGPTWGCLINNCPKGGKRSMMDVSTTRRHQKQGSLWFKRPEVACKPRHPFGSEEGVCVGPLCCDTTAPSSMESGKCSVDYNACGSSQKVMEQFALCLSPGLVCDRDTQKCCNFYDQHCFDSIMCRRNDADAFRDQDLTQVNIISAYENLSDHKNIEDEK